MKTTLSQRMQILPISSIRRLTPYANIARSEGVHIYHLNIGAPDVKSPNVMIEALQKWNANPIDYAPSEGTKDYLEALKWYYHQLGHSFIKTTDILATTAGSEALNISMFACCNPGDEILVFEPFYSNYKVIAHMWGVSLVPVETSIEEGFHLPSRAAIERKISLKTKAILYCSPGNPTGTVYTKAEVELLVSIAKDHDLYLISDEVYREYVFTGSPTTSLLSYMKEMPQLAIVLDSLSKRYSICGARLGCLVSLNKDVIKGGLKFAQSHLSAGIVDQYIGSQLTKVPESYILGIQQEYLLRRDILYNGLKSIDGVRLTLPEGAFYIFAELPVTNAEEFCIFLLEKYRDRGETLMLAPGNGFYANPLRGSSMVRFAYVLAAPKLKRALELLKGGLEVYKLNKKEERRK